MLIADTVCHKLKNYGGRLPSNSDLVGVARTLLSSVDVWGTKNRSPRGYLHFLAGFIERAAASRSNDGYSAEGIIRLFESRGGFLTDNPDADDSRDDWSAKNARRVALIHQRFAQGLDATETRELEHLQDLATERLEAWDSQLLSDVAAMRKAVERVVPPTGTATAT